MNKYITLILFIFMFIPFYAKAETCDIDKITIGSITIVSKSDNVEELEEATTSGKNINLNLSMSEVGDNIEYKFIVKNDSNEDYELDKTGLNIKSDYMDYSFETEDKSNRVKAKSSKNVTLRVEYKTEVPEDKFENGSYNDNKTLIVQLSNGNTINVPDTFKNPNTGVQSYILILVVALIVGRTLYVLLKKKKYVKFMILLIGVTIIVPMSVYALCKSEIKIESNITIEKEIHEFCYAPGVYACGITSNYYDLHYYEYIPGETFEEFFERNNLTLDYGELYMHGYSNGKELNFEIDTFWSFNDHYSSYHVSTDSWRTKILDKEILGKEFGCYSMCAD